MYHLLLESGDFVTYDQISHDEVEVIGANITEAHSFLTLEEARSAAKAVNNRQDGKFTLYSSEDVVAVMQEFSLV